MTDIRGASNAKANRELAWNPAHPSWREGFRGIDEQGRLIGRIATGLGCELLQFCHGEWHHGLPRLRSARRESTGGCPVGGRREHCLATRASRRASLGTVRSSSRAALDAMIAEATVDCYNDSECITGFYTMLEEHLDMPFQTVVLGVEATVTGIDLTDDEQIVAICARGRSRQRIPILDLPLPTPPAGGAEWIAAYR